MGLYEKFGRENECAKDRQTKGELQLKDLNEAVNFISTKFDEYEKERKERKQIIKNLEENVSVMNEEEIWKSRKRNR